MKKKIIEFLPFIIALLTFVILLNSCTAYKEKICKTCAIIKKDSVNEAIKITPFDTNLFISGYKRKFELTGKCLVLCDSINKLIDFYNKKGLDFVVSKGNGTKTTINKSAQGNFVFTTELDSLKKLVTLLKYEKNRTHFVLDTVEAKCTKQHYTWIDGFYKRGFWFFVILFVIVMVLFFIYKRYLVKVIR
jgi:hypothetical protein